MQYDLSNYDEDKALIRYVWDNYRGLLSGSESLSAHLLAYAIKSPRRLSQNMIDKLDPRIAQQLADDPRGANEYFRQQTAQRILLEQPEKVSINRCPRCERIVRTPAARQCLWCGHDWH